MKFTLKELNLLHGILSNEADLRKSDYDWWVEAEMKNNPALSKYEAEEQQGAKRAFKRYIDVKRLLIALEETEFE